MTPQGTPPPAPSNMRGLTRALALVALVLGGIYGFSIGTAFVPGAEILAGGIMGICGAAFSVLFWKLLSPLPANRCMARMVRAAIAMILTVPTGTYVTTLLVLFMLNPWTSWQNPADVLELGLFMVRFSVVHLGVITLPVAALAGAVAVAR